MNTIKVLLADDHRIIREGLRLLLDASNKIDVLGEADDGRAVIEMLSQILPDVIVMDVSMPELNGIDTTERIRKEYPSVKILALSMHTDRRYIEGMLKAGASGYLVKNCATAELISAVELVAAGGVWLSPKIAGKVDKGKGHLQADATLPDSGALTSREREMLQLIAGGKDTKEIAFELNLSPKTVEAHRRNIMEKLDIHNVANLTKYAIREGLIDLDV